MDTLPGSRRSSTSASPCSTAPGASSCRAEDSAKTSSGASGSRDHDRDVKGDPDLLNLTRPEIVSEIHHSYLEAGADITTTNTFTATSIGQADYGLQAPSTT